MGFFPFPKGARIISTVLLLFSNGVSSFLNSPTTDRFFLREIRDTGTKHLPCFDARVTLGTSTTTVCQSPRQQPNKLARSTHLRLGSLDSNNNDDSPKNPMMDPGLKLLVCILIDFIGVASFAAPGLGEATDVAWAPISALLIQYLFGNGIFTALALVEELSPGLDFLPTATIAWFLENANSTAPTENPTRDERLSVSTSPKDDSNVIDVDVVD